MMLNWGVWLQGAISAISDGVLIGLGVMVFVPGQTTVKQIALICAIPVVKGFFTYIKQSPPPIGTAKLPEAKL